jgi:hypothetical protein
MAHRCTTQQNRRAPRYRAWLLRRWAANQPGASADTSWRYSLEDPQTGSQHDFASVADVVAYLQADPGEDEIAPRPTGSRPGD